MTTCMMRYYAIWVDAAPRGTCLWLSSRRDSDDQSMRGSARSSRLGTFWR